MDPSIWNQLLDIGVAVISITLMIGIGLALEPRALRHAGVPVGTLSWQFAAVVILPPLIGLVTVALLKPPPEIAAGILLLAACPVGDIANVYTLLARGSTPRSLLLSSLTSVAAPVTMTLVFAIYHFFGISEEFLAIPAGTLFLRLLLLLVVPVGIGMLVRHRLPRVARHIERPLHRFAGVGILLLLGLVLLSPAFRIESYHHAAVAALVFLLLSLGLAIPLLKWGAGRNIRSAAFLCIPVRNVGVAALIAISLLERKELAAVMAIYFVIEVPLLWGIARAISRWGEARNLAESSASA